MNSYRIKRLHTNLSGYRTDGHSNVQIRVQYVLCETIICHCFLLYCQFFTSFAATTHVHLYVKQTEDQTGKLSAG